MQFNDNLDNSTEGSINDGIYDNVQKESTDDGFRNIPDEIDEELPFN